MIDKETYKFPESTPIPEPEQQQRAEQLFGMFQTVSAVPTLPPKNFLDQIQYYKSGATLRLYIWDNKNITWSYTALT